MKRLGEIAAILVIACGWICAQEKSPAQVRREKAAKVEQPAAQQAKAVVGPEKPAPSLENPVGAPERAEQPPKPERPAGGWWDDVFTERNVPLYQHFADHSYRRHQVGLCK